MKVHESCIEMWRGTRLLKFSSPVEMIHRHECTCIDQPIHSDSMSLIGVNAPTKKNTSK